MSCRRCQERIKDWHGADPDCGFDDAGKFTTENWNCATLNALRDMCEGVYSEDSRAALVSCEEGWLVVYWYKRRGRTDEVYLFDGFDLQAVSLSKIEQILDSK